METAVQGKNIRAIKASRVHSSLDKSAKVTIGIPAYNERGAIGFLITKLLSQVGADVVEIVVSDDGSTDGTGAEVLQAAKKAKSCQCTVKVVEGKPRLGKAAAIDRILRVARGDIIVLIDADARVHDDCVANIVKPLSVDESIGVVSGNILPLSLIGQNGFFSFISGFQRELNDRLSRRLLNENQAPKVNGAFFAIRKEAVTRIPHSVVSDDEYISWCAQKRGYKVTYVSEAKVYANDPMNMRDYMAKRRRILGGHFLIGNMTHYSVPTTRISLLVPEFGKSVVKHWKKMPYVMAMLILECLCRPLAFSDAIQGKVSPCYSARARTESAKSAIKKGST